ncbi:MAG: 50S ribosomal protein L16 [Candidatus Bathyarchaeota archaeon]|nr:50S ribosomal protein L16 [Candidatus Bathyarchaeota archaeon]
MGRADEEYTMKARNYREVKGQSYTRKKYIRGSPASKIVKFTMGNTSGTYKYQARLIAEKEVQIRHNALEAARIAANRVLSEKLGNSYVLKILPYPHVVLRENKMIFGAHADRLQDGMRNAFGKAIGLAARVKTGQSLILANVNENGLQAATTALKRGGAKLPTPCRVVVKKLED